MIKRIKQFFRDIRELWEISKKPSKKELKRILYTTFLLFFIVAGISLAIFITVQYLLYIWQFT